jgi:hypothetical protein
MDEVDIDDDDDADDEDVETLVGGVEAAVTPDVDDRFNPLINDGELCC